VYATAADAPQHPASLAVVEAGLDGRLPAVLVPQVLLEFMAVVTHPRRVEHPLDPQTAWQQVIALQVRLPVLELRPAALAVFGELVLVQRPAGSDVFDLFLVAQMRTHGVTAICTYNTRHFAGLQGIEALTAEETLARHIPS
jgi:predicted nucleic acid-binding protein